MLSQHTPPHTHTEQTHGHIVKYHFHNRWVAKTKKLKRLQTSVHGESIATGVCGVPACVQACGRTAEVRRNPFRITLNVRVWVSVMHSQGGLSSSQNSNMVFGWHTANIYIWINMRKTQINERNAGKNNPVKDQTAGSLSPASTIPRCFNFS